MKILDITDDYRMPIASLDTPKNWWIPAMFNMRFPEHGSIAETV